MMRIAKLNPLKSLTILCFISLFFTVEVHAEKVNEIILTKTLDWNRHNNTKNLHALEDMYSRDIHGYVTYKGIDAMIRAKQSFFNKNKDFTQRIITDLVIKRLEGGSVLCEFTKQSTFKGKTKDYPSYLWFKKTDGDYLIVEESDYITNKSRQYVGEYPPIESTSTISLDTTVSKGSSNKIVGIALALLLLVILLYVFHKKKGIKTLVTPFYKIREYLEGPLDVSHSSPAAASKSENANKIKGNEFEKHVVSRFNKDFFTPVRWQGVRLQRKLNFWGQKLRESSC